MKEVVVVDLENTVAYLTPPFQLLLRSEKGIKKSRKELEKSYDYLGGLSWEEAKPLFRKVWDDSDLIPLVHPIIPQAFRILRSREYLIRISTRTLGNHRNVRAWLDSKFEVDEVRFVKHRFGKISKDARKYIDDQPDFVLEAARRGNTVRIIPQRYNRSVTAEASKFGDRLLRLPWDKIPQSFEPQAATIPTHQH